MIKVFKKLLSGVLLPVVVLCTLVTTGLLSSCNEPDMPFLILNEEVVVINSETTKFSVDVKSNETWTASTTASWVKVANVGGYNKGQFEVLVESNQTPNERSAEISVKSENCAVTLLLRQSSKGTILTISEEAVNFTKNADSKGITVACNNEWNVTSSSSWCTVSKDNGTGLGAFEINVSENNSGVDRTAIVSIITESNGVIALKEIKVYQSASNADLVVTPADKTFTAAGGEFIVSVVTNGTWKATTDSDWVTLNKASGSGDFNIPVSVEENVTGGERTATISIYTGAENENRVIREVVITQVGEEFFLEVPVADYALDKEAQSISIPFIVGGSDIKVIASSGASWAKVAAIGEDKVEVTINENITGTAREIGLVITAKAALGTPISRYVRIAQSPTINCLDVLVKELAVSFAGEKIRIPIYTNTDVATRTNVSWINVAIEESDVVVTIDKNETAALRQGFVTINTTSEKGDPISKTVAITQYSEEAALAVSPSEQSFLAPVQSFVMDVITTGTWKAATDCAWITLSATSGKGDAMVTANVTENTTGSERKGVITFATGPENSKRVVCKVVVTQSPDEFYFDVPVETYYFDKSWSTLYVHYNVSDSTLVPSVKINSDWIVLDFIKDCMAQFRINENATAKAREATIVFTMENLKGQLVTDEVKVLQSPTVNFLDVLTDEVVLSPYGEEYFIPVITNAEISFKSSSDWCEVDNDTRYLRISAGRNETAQGREAEVVIYVSSGKGEVLSKKIKVIQPSIENALMVTPGSQIVTAAAQSFEFTVVTRTEWTIQSDKSWVTFDEVSNEGDDVVTVNVSANTTGKDRSAVISVISSSINGERIIENVAVTQLANDFYFIVPQKSFAFDKNATDAQTAVIFEYIAVGDIISVDASSNEKWCEIDIDDVAKTGTINVSENTTAEPRFATIQITAVPAGKEPVVKTIMVAQAPTVNVLDIYVDEYIVNWQGEEFSLPIYTNTELTISSSNINWCTIPTYTEGQQYFDIIVAENTSGFARNAIVTLKTTSEKGEKLTKIITIRQESNLAYFELDHEAFAVTKAEGEVGVGFSLSTDLEVVDIISSTNADWLGVEPIVDSLILTYEENTTDQPREATATFKIETPNGELLTQKVVVRQSPTENILDVFVNEYNVSWQGEIFNFIVNANTPINVTSSSLWCQVDPAIDSVKVTVLPNTTGEPREAFITLKTNDTKGRIITKIITIRQESNIAYFQVDHEVYVFTNALGTQNIDFQLSADMDSTDISLSTNNNWASVTNNSGTITVTYTANTSEQTRFEDVTLSITAPNGELLTQKVTLVQSPTEYYLDVIEDEVHFTADGGDEGVAVYHNAIAADFTQTTNVAWLDVNQSVVDENIYFFTAETNTSFAAREASVVFSATFASGRTERKVVKVTQDADVLNVGFYQDDIISNYEAKDDITVMMYGVDTINGDEQYNANVDWIQGITYNDQTLSFDITEDNTTGQVRQGVITFTYTINDVVKVLKLTVFQLPTESEFELGTSLMIFDEQEHSFTIPYTVTPANVSATISIISNTDWMTVIGNNIHLSENNAPAPREGYLSIIATLSDGSTQSAVLKVFQGGEDYWFHLIHTDNSQYLPYYGGSFQVDYVTSDEQKVIVSTSAGWLGESSHTYDENGGHIIFNCGSNSYYSRSATIDLFGIDPISGKEFPITIPVYQSAHHPY